jgi:hypothetical protein
LNPWDLLSWICSAALAGSAILIFALFLRDARSILDRSVSPPGDEPEPPRDPPR